MGVPRWVLASVFVAVAVGPASAAAQEQPAPDSEIDLREGEARALYEAGAMAFAAGDFEGARDHFQQAYELSHRPRLLYNVALAADRLRDDRAALEAFERYLEAEPDTPHRGNVEARIAALRHAIEARERGPAEERGAAGEETGPSAVTPADAAATEEQARAGNGAGRSVDLEGTPTPDERGPAAGGSSILGEWWLWTLVGVVVAGAAVTTVILVTRDPGVESPELGTQGAIATTLRFP